MKTKRTMKAMTWILIITVILSMNLVGTVFAAAPTNVQITGTLRPGYPLTVSYSGDPGATYAWFRCPTDAAGDAGTAITSATASTYTLVNADGGKYIKCAVTTGTDTTLSAATSVIAVPLTNVTVGQASSIQATAPAINKFALASDASKTFLLLDPNGTGASKYFVVAASGFGSTRFDLNQNIQKFDLSSTSNIAYKLNHEYISSTGYTLGAVTYKLPDGIINNLDANHVWLTEAGGSAGPCPNDYTTTCGVAIMSVNEMLTYKAKLGWSDTGYYVWTRTPNPATTNCLFGFKYDASWQQTGRDDNWTVRPCFWLGENFFKTVKLDVNSLNTNVSAVGANDNQIKAMIKAQWPSKSDISATGLYTELEMEALGYGSAQLDTNAKVKDVKITGSIGDDGKIKLDGTPLTPSFTWDGSATQGKSVVKWFQSTAQAGPYTEISGATDSYTLKYSDSEKWLKIEVTPVTQAGSAGAPVESVPVQAETAAIWYNKSSGLPAVGPEAYRFQLDPTLDANRKTFILLDDTGSGASKFFVETFDSYGNKRWEDNNNGTRSQRFDLIESDGKNRMGWWLNNTFKNSGNGADINGVPYMLPGAIKSKIDQNHVWDTEGGNDSGTAPYPYQSTAGIALMSATELVKYKTKMGWSDGGESLYYYTRSPSTAGNVHLITFNIHDKGTSIFTQTGTDDNITIRPCFWLNEDFFEIVKLDVNTLGSIVRNYIIQNYRIDNIKFKAMYSDDELKKIFDIYGSIAFKDQNNTAVDNLVSSQTKLTASASILKSSEVPEELSLILASYNVDGKLIGINTSKQTFTEGNNDTLSTTLNNLTQESINGRVKAFLWSTKDGKIKPVVASKTLRLPFSVGGIKLPDPLVSRNGAAVKTVQEWENIRRPELLDMFTENMFGESLPLPTAQSYNVTQLPSPSGITSKQVAITITGPYGSRTMNMFLHLPTTSKDKKVPVFLLLNNRDVPMGDPNSTNEFFPVQDMLKRGYGMAAFYNADAAIASDDNPSIFRNGLINIFIPSTTPIPDNGGRCISTWAYAASRCLDYLLTDELVDGGKVAVLGHSRGGKSALWAGATDKRFAYVISNDSGNSGAALARQTGGETVLLVNTSYPHWFSRNYKKFSDRENDMPFDEHELIALIAPRMVQVASGSTDNNSYPRNEFYSTIGAKSVYDLYDPNYKINKDAADFPSLSMNTLYSGNRMAYHVREGGHNLLKIDWNLYADFADKAGWNN